MGKGKVILLPPASGTFGDGVHLYRQPASVRFGSVRFRVYRAMQLRIDVVRGNETGKVVTVHGSVEPAKRHQFASIIVDVCDTNNNLSLQPMFPPKPLDTLPLEVDAQKV